MRSPRSNGSRKVVPLRVDRIADFDWHGRRQVREWLFPASPARIAAREVTFVLADCFARAITPEWAEYREKQPSRTLSRTLDRPWLESG